MEKTTATHSTFTIERHYPASPERVFAAFADPAKKRRWFKESRGSEEFEMDFRVGGNERTVTQMGPDTPFPGALIINRTNYQDIVPDRRIVFAYTMTMGEHPFSASLATIELLPKDKGTDLLFTEQSAFFEGADGAEMRQAGWRSLLDNLGAELAA